MYLHLFSGLLYWENIWSLLIKNQLHPPKSFGRLPTGDSLIDIAGHPGPKGIGYIGKTRFKRSQTQRLAYRTRELVLQNISNPPKAKQICQQATKKLDSYTDGSRFYNVKQFRNACVRQLAKAKSYDAAFEILQENFPLHNQDWACPNRQGILEAIGGRLLVLSDSPEKHVQALEDSIQTSLDFLEKVSLAEQGKLQQPKPPSMGLPSNAPKHQRNTNQRRHNALRIHPVFKSPSTRYFPFNNNPFVAQLCQSRKTNTLCV